MRVLRVLLGSLLWIVAGVVVLLGAVLCVTVVLLPVGIPLIMLGRRIMGAAVALIMPRAVTHPVDEGTKSVKGAAGSVVDRVKDIDVDTKGLRKRAKRSRKKIRKVLA